VVYRSAYSTKNVSVAAELEEQSYRSSKGKRVNYQRATSLHMDMISTRHRLDHMIIQYLCSAMEGNDGV
jgi:hypothetical protein